MQDLNVVMLSGKVWKNAETRSTRAGAQVTNFAIISENSKGEDEFNRCCTWGASKAFDTAKDLKKGDTVVVQGRLQSRSRENEEGKRTYWTQIVVNVINTLTVKAVQVPGEEITDDNFDDYFDESA